MNPSGIKHTCTCDADTQRMIKATYLAVTGDNSIGVSGLVVRMKNNERKVGRLTFYCALICAAAIGNTATVKQFLASLFH